jgi:hypothetical protein
MPSPSPSTNQLDESDPFDALLTLEDTLYTTAYTLGVSDGAHAGRIEGRIFGLEKGFEKFADLGQLHGKSVIWASRLPNLTPNSKLDSNFSSSRERKEDEESRQARGECNDGIRRNALPPLPPNPRLQNNTTLLHSLTDPETFDTANTEEAVADFDDRFKRAGAKAKVIERIVGETDATAGSAAPSASKSKKSPERSPPARGGGKRSGPVRVAGPQQSKKGDGSMEDFAGSKLLR